VPNYNYYDRMLAKAEECDELEELEQLARCFHADHAANVERPKRPEQSKRKQPDERFAAAPTERRKPPARKR
jgi:hypothetical protein